MEMIFYLTIHCEIFDMANQLIDWLTERMNVWMNEFEKEWLNDWISVWTFEWMKVCAN